MVNASDPYKKIPEWIRQISHNAPINFVTEICTHVHISATTWCIVEYATGALWDLCNRSILLDAVLRCSTQCDNQSLLKKRKRHENNKVYSRQIYTIHTYQTIQTTWYHTLFTIQDDIQYIKYMYFFFTWRTRVYDHKAPANWQVWVD